MTNRPQGKWWSCPGIGEGSGTATSSPCGPGKHDITLNLMPMGSNAWLSGGVGARPASDVPGSLSTSTAIRKEIGEGPMSHQKT